MGKRRKNVPGRKNGCRLSLSIYRPTAEMAGRRLEEAKKSDESTQAAHTRDGKAEIILKVEAFVRVVE